METPVITREVLGEMTKANIAAYVLENYEIEISTDLNKEQMLDAFYTNEVVATAIAAEATTDSAETTAPDIEVTSEEDTAVADSEDSETAGDTPEETQDTPEAATSDELLFEYDKGDVQLHQLIDRYLKLVQKTDIKRTIKALNAIFKYIFVKPTDENLETVWALFSTDKFKTSILSENTVFRGIAVLSNSERRMTEYFYTLYREYVDGEFQRIDMKKIEPILGQPVVVWFAKKKRAKK